VKSRTPMHYPYGRGESIVAGLAGVARAIQLVEML